MALWGPRPDEYAVRATYKEGLALVEEGKPAPDFTLPSDTGEEVSLSSLRGGPVVVYFYPRDDSRASIHSKCA